MRLHNRVRTTGKRGRHRRLPSRVSFFNERVDLFHKVCFLLLLHTHFLEDQVNRDCVRQITFADAPTLDEAVNELRDAGLLIMKGEVLSVRDATEVRSDLDTLARVHEDPTGRQELLRRLYRHSAVPF